MKSAKNGPFGDFFEKLKWEIWDHFPRLWSTSKQKTTLGEQPARDKFNFHPRLLHWTAAAAGNKTLTIWPSVWFFSFQKDLGKVNIAYSYTI